MGGRCAPARSYGVGEPSLNSVVMRLVSALPLFALLVAGCITHADPGFRPLCLSPSNADLVSLEKDAAELSELRAQLKADPALEYVTSARTFVRWFASADKTRMLFCHVPEFPRSCGSSFATFSKRDGRWSVDEPLSEVVCAS